MYYTTEIGICIPYNASLQTFIEILKKKGLIGYVYPISSLG